MKRHMKAQVARVNVSYEVSFRRPLLDWASAALPLFQSLYDRLSENFSLTLADVAVHADPHPAYAVASIRLFGGAGAVELESPTVPYAIEAKARPELGWDWGKGATNPQFQNHLENKALTLAGLMSPRVSERGSVPSLSRLLQDFRIRCLIGRPGSEDLEAHSPRRRRPMLASGTASTSKSIVVPFAG
jgi:hypothetical protein